MKTKVLIIGIVILFAAAGFAQQKFTISPYLAYSMSAFEEQESAESAIMIGAYFGYKAMPALEVGAEFNYPIMPYSEKEGELEETVKQYLLGVYGKYFIGAGNLKPFVKGGVGYYMGNASWKDDGDEGDLDIDSAIGFNFGGGVLLSLGFFAEFNYHIVTRHIEHFGDQGMNTWAIMVGYQVVK